MVQAIETRYAGCHFRSRLEARWAVFFDHLGIRWEYEQQGYTTTNRLTNWCEPTRVPYLPDFWLPDFNLFAEVKGSLTTDECIRLLDAAASLSSADGAGCHNNGGNDVVVLGSVPRDPAAVPVRLHMHKGDLVAAPFNPVDHPRDRYYCSGSYGAWRLAYDVGGDGLFEVSDIPGASGRRSDLVSDAALTSSLLLNGFTNPTPSRATARTRYGRALTAARSARFEHGQSGASLPAGR